MHKLNIVSLHTYVEDRRGKKQKQMARFKFIMQCIEIMFDSKAIAEYS